MNLGNFKTSHKILAVIALLGLVAAASQVLSAANDLSKQAEMLRAEFHDFVAVVRAA